MRAVVIATTMVFEYALIIKLQLISLKSTTPRHWKYGTKSPVVVLPGSHETFWFLHKLITFFNDKGHPVHIIQPYNSIDSIPNLSNKAGQYIKDKKLENVILLTHSKGGIVAKHLLTHNPEINAKVQKVVSIAAPFCGSKLGHLRIHKLGEMKPNSALIRDLNGHSSLNSKFLNLYPTIDNHVLPNASCVLVGAENIQIPVIGHTRILESTKTVDVLSKYF